MVPLTTVKGMKGEKGKEIFSLARVVTYFFYACSHFRSIPRKKIFLQPLHIFSLFISIELELHLLAPSLPSWPVLCTFFFEKVNDSSGNDFGEENITSSIIFSPINSCAFKPVRAFGFSRKTKWCFVDCLATEFP